MAPVIPVPSLDDVVEAFASLVEPFKCSSPIEGIVASDEGADPERIREEAVLPSRLFDDSSLRFDLEVTGPRGDVGFNSARGFKRDRKKT